MSKNIYREFLTGYPTLEDSCQRQNNNAYGNFFRVGRSMPKISLKQPRVEGKDNCEYLCSEALIKLEKENPSIPIRAEMFVRINKKN